MLSENEIEQVRLKVIKELTSKIDPDKNEPGERFIKLIIEIASKVCSKMLIEYQKTVSKKENCYNGG